VFPLRISVACREEADEALVSWGFMFLGYTWLPDQQRTQPDEELWIYRDGSLLLWLNYVDLVAQLYKRVKRAPREIKWELITKPGEPFAVHASGDRQWVKATFPPLGTTWFFRKCAETDIAKEGIPVTCERNA